MSTPVVDDRMRMLIPTTNRPWPPPEYNPITFQWRLWNAWWSGDKDQLSWAYYNLGANSPVGRSFFATTGEPGLPIPRPGQFRGGLLGSINYSFHGTPVPPGEKRTKLHVPIASDIAATSADLLFSKPPTITASNPANQAALDDLMDDGTHARLLEAAETCSALGGVFLRVVWDTEVSDKPMLDVVPADAAVPYFSHGKLMGVTFWRIISDDGSEVVRHLETHAPGQNAIFHNVYVGDQTDLGRSYPLTDFPETATFAQYLSSGNAIHFPDMDQDASTVVYIPNMLPNKIWRDLGPQVAPLGRSDYAGVEPLMDSLDEAYSSWQRDIRLAKARLIVPQQMLDNIGRGKGAVFDPDRQVYSPISMMTSSGGTSDIMANQFVIRWQEHQQTCQDYINRIVQGAGYSGQTFGEYDGGQGMTATEIRARERKSLITRNKKVLYWRPGLRDILYGWLAVKRSVFNDNTVSPERPEAEFPEVVLPDQLELAQTVSAISQADAGSKETLVRMLHPDWSDEEIRNEVRMIYAETGLDLANRARVMLQPPMNSTETIAQEIQELADPESAPSAAWLETGDTDDD
ncbi:phage portal protein [Streptomyces sp. NPDC001118]